MFFEKKTEYSTAASCLDDNEMRSDDWYFVADQRESLSHSCLPSYPM